jgi:hypothetical protein
MWCNGYDYAAIETKKLARKTIQLSNKRKKEKTLGDDSRNPSADGDHYSLYQYWHVTNCTVEYISSFRSSPVDCSGSTVFLFPPRGRVELLSFCCDAMSYAVLCGYRRFSRQMAPYVYDGRQEGDSDSVESGEKSFLCAQTGIEPAISRLWDEYDTTRPLPAHYS